VIKVNGHFMNGERMGTMNEVYSTKWKSMHAKENKVKVIKAKLLSKQN